MNVKMGWIVITKRIMKIELKNGDKSRHSVFLVLSFYSLYFFRSFNTFYKNGG
jgi:hypothetical protein